MDETSAKNNKWEIFVTLKCVIEISPNQDSIEKVKKIVCVLLYIEALIT